MPKASLPSIQTIKNDFPEFTFSKHQVFHWSPVNNTVYYDVDELNSPEGIYQLLHEVGHALCGHKNYTSGIQLLKIESQAWVKAKQLALSYGLKINQKQIERCLDSYRDWLHLRSTCPACQSISIETEANSYHCFNCFQDWKVSPDQRRRHYRIKLQTQH